VISSVAGLNEPKLVVGDGALGAWAALRDVFPGAGEQRCWFHASGNVIDALPKCWAPLSLGMPVPLWVRIEGWGTKEEVSRSERCKRLTVPVAGTRRGRLVRQASKPTLGKAGNEGGQW
jgi:Transposase, Mutator family